MPLTIAGVMSAPALATWDLAQLDESQHAHAVFRPLASRDMHPLARFLEGLSPLARERSTFPSYDFATASDLCDAIGKYDKLRMVVETGGSVVGLVEFSFDLPSPDVERYRDAGVDLDQRTDCRFGPTLADEYQGRDSVRPCSRMSGVGRSVRQGAHHLVGRCSRRQPARPPLLPQDGIRGGRVVHQCSRV